MVDGGFVDCELNLTDSCLYPPSKGDFYNDEQVSNLKRFDLVECLKDGMELWEEEYVKQKTLDVENTQSEFISSDPRYRDGLDKCKKFFEFVLVDIRELYVLTGLQFKLLYDVFLTPIIVTLFGKPIFSQYEKNLLKILGIKNQQLFSLYRGRRRDGKTILICAITAAIMAICEHETGKDFYIPLLGPGESTGNRLVSNIASFFRIDKVRKKYSHLKVNSAQKKLEIINLKNGRKKIAQSRAPTSSSLRGVNSDFDIIDEFEFLGFVKHAIFNIPRYMESWLGAVAITTPNIETTEYDVFFENTDKVRFHCERAVCEECIPLLNTAQFNGKFKDLQDYCVKKGHVSPKDVPWESLDAHGWSKYQPLQDAAAESGGIRLSKGKPCFGKKSVDDYCNKKVDYPINMYDYFCMGVDPSGRGGSENAIALAGVKGYDKRTFNSDLLSLDGYKDKTLQTTSFSLAHNIFMMINECSKRNMIHPTRITPFYIFIESPGDHAPIIENYLNVKWRDGLPDNIRIIVIKQLSGCTRYGIWLGRNEKLGYITSFSNAMTSNTTKISYNFFTLNPNGSKFILNNLKQQLHNMVTDENGKIGGKGGGKFNDDMAIVVMMMVYWLTRLLDREHNPKLHSQMDVYNFDDFNNHIKPTNLFDPVLPNR